MHIAKNRLLPGLCLTLGCLLTALPAVAGPFQPRNPGKAKEKTEAQLRLEQAKESKAEEPAEENKDEAAAPPRPEREGPEIPLRGNLRMVIRPTILGLVPNRDPEGYGELFARVVASEGSRVRLYFEVKEMVDRKRPTVSWLDSLRTAQVEEQAKTESSTGGTEPSAGPADVTGGLSPLGDELPTERPVGLTDFGHRINQTRIRRGELSFAGLDAGAMASPPLFWTDGPWQALGSGIWLSRSLLAQLHAEGEAPWHRFEIGRENEAGSAETATLLVRNAQASYPCVINGARVMLPALYCRDSMGLAEYWIHDDVDNPLLLKMSFLPPDGLEPIESIIELDESDSPADGRDPRLPKLLVKRSGSASEQSESDADAQQTSEGGYSSSASNQFGGRERQAPPDVKPPAPTVSGATETEPDSSKQPAALAGAPSLDYRPPTIDELVACGGGYAIVEIDF